MKDFHSLLADILGIIGNTWCYFGTIIRGWSIATHQLGVWSCYNKHSENVKTHVSCSIMIRKTSVDRTCRKIHQEDIFVYLLTVHSSYWLSILLQLLHWVCGNKKKKKKEAPSSIASGVLILKDAFLICFHHGLWIFWQLWLRLLLKIFMDRTEMDVTTSACWLTKNDIIVRAVSDLKFSVYIFMLCNSFNTVHHCFVNIYIFIFGVDSTQ